MNRTIAKYLSKIVSNHEEDWNQHISFFFMEYRSAANEFTGQTPARVLFGKEMRLLCDRVFGCKPGEYLVGEDYVTE